MKFFNFLFKFLFKKREYITWNDFAKKVEAIDIHNFQQEVRRKNVERIPGPASRSGV